MATHAQTQIILVVEDNDDDFEAVEYALRRCEGFSGAIERCTSGHDALDFLMSRNAYAAPYNKAIPSLILLDLNLRGVTGKEVLTRIKGDEDLKQIPIIVLTSSTDRRDIAACYRAGANAYLQKEMELEKLGHAISRMKEFWFDAAILPSDSS